MRLDLILAARKARPRVRKPAGRCFEIALNTFLRLPDPTDWRLAHGTVNAAPDGGDPRTIHAWLEHNDDTVYDPTSDEALPRGVYFDRYSVITTARYDLEQAVRWEVATKHYGPWPNQ